MNDTTVEIPKRAFNKCYFPLLNNESRYLIFYGGAGSGKSFFIAQRFIVKILQQNICNLLVVRAVGNTNRDSTFALLKQVISKWQLNSFFRYSESELRITCIINGNSIIFKGLDDTEKLKSITFAKGELTDIWIEEATETDEQSFKQLDVRLRGKGSKKQITLSFNPTDVNHWLKKRFAQSKEENITFFHTTYKDNEFLDEDYVKLLESFKDSDPYYYMVYCLGQWGVFGKTIFNAQQVNERISCVNPPIRQGYFDYDYDGVNITNSRFIEDENGAIKIYEEAKPLYPYVIGGDTAGEGSDSFTGIVIDNTNGKQVAVLKHSYDEDVYARQMYCIGEYYNNSLIGIETNFSTYPVKELLRLGYNHLYVREREDSYTKSLVKAFGFKTTSSTRPSAIAELVKFAREDINLICDIDTLYEMLTFVRNEKGRAEAQNGSHDDLIMALAIAHYIRGQQRYTVKEIETEIDSKFWTNFKKPKEKSTGYGEEIKVW